VRRNDFEERRPGEEEIGGDGDGILKRYRNIAVSDENGAETSDDSKSMAYRSRRLKWLVAA
jgi:hypothetical protein